MTLEGTVRLTNDELKLAVAEFVSRQYGIKVETEKVSVYPTGEFLNQIRASVGVDVSVTNGERQ